MTWSLFRWVWQLEGSLYVGMPPSGSLNRTRVYVPARALWGALTAELARNEAKNAEPRYQAVGQTLQDGYRFTYLYPAEVSGNEWKAWLPTYQDGQGLAWQREDGGEPVSDRALRRRLLSTRPGTAIDASTDAAEEGSLRETECVNDRWRGLEEGEDNRVAYVGYVFRRTDAAKDLATCVHTLFLGGDTRYGLGRMRREAFELTKSADVFGARATLDAVAPLVAAARVLAHTQVSPEQPTIIGALELLGGWDRGSLRPLDESSRFWQPGSRGADATSWTIEPEGTWKATEARA